MLERSVIDRFLALDRIAFAGASREPKQFANSVYRHLRDGGRTLLPVHPEAATVEGDPCVASVADLPDDVGGIIVMLESTRALDVVGEAIERGIPMVWLHRGIGGAGAVSDEAVARCEAAGVEVVPGACPLMFAEPVGWFHRAHRGIARRHIAA